MLFYYCRNCSRSAAILIDSHWTTNLIKFIYSTDWLFLVGFFFWLNKGQQRWCLIWSKFKIWLVKWPLPQRRKRANHNCLLGWGHSSDLSLPLSWFFASPLKPWTFLPLLPQKNNHFSHLYFHCQMWLKSNMFPRNWQGVEGRWENNMAVKTSYCLRETRLKAVVYILENGIK